MLEKILKNDQEIEKEKFSESNYDDTELEFLDKDMIEKLTKRLDHTVPDTRIAEKIK